MGSFINTGATQNMIDQAGTGKSWNPFKDQNVFNSKSADDPMGIYKNNGKLKVEKAEKMQLASDYNKMQNDPASLGKTQAQLDAEVGAATRAAGAGANAQIAANNDAALAGQSFQQDAFTGAAQNAADTAANAGVAATANSNKLNDAIISTEKNRIMAQLSRERDKKAENAQFWGQMGITGVASILTALGGPAGLLAGAGASAGVSNATAAAGAGLTGATSGV